MEDDSEDEEEAGDKEAEEEEEEVGDVAAAAAAAAAAAMEVLVEVVELELEETSTGDIKLATDEVEMNGGGPDGRSKLSTAKSAAASTGSQKCFVAFITF